MKHIRSTFFLLTTLFIMASCGEDRSGEYYALIGENVWIEQIMKEHYLWYDSIPAIKETDYFAEPEDFLQKLVYTKTQQKWPNNSKHTTTKSRFLLVYSGKRLFKLIVDSYQLRNHQCLSG